MFRKNKASAKIDNGRLILSMPDAETPALWMLDMSDALTTVIRVEADKQGLYVLKKHGGKGAPETIGVYRNKMHAICTLNTITRTLDKARYNTASQTKNIDYITRTLVIIMFIWFALARIGNVDQFLLNWAFPPSSQTASMPNISPDEMARYDAQITEIISRMSNEQGLVPIIPGTQPKASPPAPKAGQAGYPQSADEFLLNRSRQ